MKLNTKCSIALHCLVFLLEYEGKVKVTSELLAKSTGCNPVIIRNILNALRKAGIITVTRGVGGAHLAAAPEELTVWRVYRAVEPGGVEGMVGLHANPSPRCPVGRRIADVLAEPYGKIEAAVREAMEKITLRTIWEGYRANRENTEHEP